MALRIGFHGGVGEIGGNCFVLEDSRTRVLLDVGKRFGNDRLVEQRGLRPGWGDFFDEYLNPRPFRLVPDLLALDLVPDLPGLYREDLGGTGAGGDGDGLRPPGVDAVVVSHAHMDHVGLLGLVRPEVEVAAAPETRAVLESIQVTGQGGPETDFVRTRPKGLGRTAKGSLSTRPRHPPGPQRPYAVQEHVDAGEWTLERLPVDHSIHGACAFVVSTPDASIAYSGDFRLHGRQGSLSERFVERVQDVDVLVAEGTRVHRDAGREAHETDDEAQVEATVHEAVSREDGDAGASGFVAVSYPPRDLDRFLSLHQVARATGRRLAITTKQAHLLETLRRAGREDLPDPRRDAHVAIHLRARRQGLMLGDGVVPVARPETLGVAAEEVDSMEWRRLLEQDYDAWERPYLDAPSRVTSREVGAEPGAYLFSINYWSITELFDVFPERSGAGGLYVHSQTQPFNDDMVLNARKLARWLDAFRLRRTDTHVSGHLSQEDLDWVLDEVRPRRLVPVHSLHPDVTADRYEARSGHKALLPVTGRSVEL